MIEFILDENSNLKAIRTTLGKAHSDKEQSEILLSLLH